MDDLCTFVLYVDVRWERNGCMLKCDKVIETDIYYTYFSLWMSHAYMIYLTMKTGLHVSVFVNFQTIHPQMTDEDVKEVISSSRMTKHLNYKSKNIIYTVNSNA